MPILTIYDPDRREVVERLALPDNSINQIVTSVSKAINGEGNRRGSLHGRNRVTVTVEDC
jgi:hypothetical protein